jgi:hypothetical protein
MSNLFLIKALLWGPLAAASLHIFEEFAWPGGFRQWYLKYRDNPETVSRNFLIMINAALLLALMVGAMAGRTERGVALLLTISALLFSNGCWHVWASYKSHTYSPGTITGILLYLPLGIFEYVSWFRLQQASAGTAVFAVLIGCSYPLWSAYYHKRRKALTSAR